MARIFNTDEADFHTDDTDGNLTKTKNCHAAVGANKKFV